MDTIEKRMVIGFAGWIECDPDKTWFYYIGSDQFGSVMGGDDIRITARSYMKLPPDEQDNFILECLGEAFISSLDGELNDMTIDIEEPI